MIHLSCGAAAVAFMATIGCASTVVSVPLTNHTAAPPQRLAHLRPPGAVDLIFSERDRQPAASNGDGARRSATTRPRRWTLPTRLPCPEAWKYRATARAE